MAPAIKGKPEMTPAPDKHMEAIRELVDILRPGEREKVTRSEALEWWDRARRASKHRRIEDE